MSITDELRGYVQSWRETPNLMDDLDAGDIDGLLGDFEHIADRIDAEHEKAIQQVLMGEGGVPATDENMAEHGWIRLPKDADGEYIHVGDELDYLEALHTDVPARFKVQDMFYYGNGKWHLRAYPATYEPEKCRHRHAPTVEDVLREFALKAAGRECMTMRSDLVDEYAAKLRLREDA